MLPYDKKSLDAMAGPAREMFEQWISFFPTAPLFGVKWRFAPDGKGLDAGLKMFSPEAMMNALAPRMPADKPPAKAEAPKPSGQPAAAPAKPAPAGTVKTATVAEAPAKPVAKVPVKPTVKAAKPAATKPELKAAKPAAPKPAAAKAEAVKAAPKAKAAKAPSATPTAKKPAAPKAAPAKAPAPTPAKAEGGPVDQIKGIGPRLAEELNGMGITSVGQIAAMSKSDMTKIDEQLTTIKGRCFRDDWIGQAKALMAG